LLVGCSLERHALGGGVADHGGRLWFSIVGEIALVVKWCGVVKKRTVRDLGYIQVGRDAAPGRPSLNPRGCDQGDRKATSEW